LLRRKPTPNFIRLAVIFYFFGAGNTSSVVCLASLGRNAQGLILLSNLAADRSLDCDGYHTVADAVTQDTALWMTIVTLSFVAAKRMGAGPMMDYIVCEVILVGMFVFTIVLAAYLM
jgi:hypothetical protein